jgi:hypothetical protein
MGMAIAATCILALSAYSSPALAESDEYADAGSDEGIAAWSVARLKVVDGSAWVLAPGESDWQEFEGNAPLPSGSRVRAADESRLEIGFSSGGRVRLSEGADLELRALKEDRVNLTLYEGKAGFLLPEDDFFSPVNVTLPDGQVVRFPKPGQYRIESAGLGEENIVQVRKGEARIRVGDGKYRVSEGEEATVGEGVTIGRLAAAEAEEGEPPPAELTGVEQNAAAPPAVVTELSDYGDWVSVPTYGVVWRPRVAVGWSPYYYGHWSFIGSIGWCWISVEPWGWYPYRTGYWFEDPGFGWCWTPYRSFVSVSWSSGRRHFRPSWYYPSTVRFVRDSGNVRWVPLRPGERFTRPSIPRTERALTAWRKPIPRQTVFERDPGRRGRETPQWRDAQVDRPARSPAVRPAPVVRQQPSVRPTPTVRPAPTGRPAPTVRPMPTNRREGDGGRRTIAPPARQIPEARPAAPRERMTPAPSPVRERPAIQPAPRWQAPRVEPPQAMPVPETPRPPSFERERVQERIQERAPRTLTAPERPPAGVDRGAVDRGGFERGGGDRGGGDRGGRGGR